MRVTRLANTAILLALLTTICSLSGLHGQALKHGGGSGTTTSSPCSGTAARNTVCAGPALTAGTPGFRALVSADIPNNAASTAGNSATATLAALATVANALANTPQLCSAGSAPQGIDVHGNPAGCQVIAGGGSGPIFVDQIVPTGTVNGVNTAFTLPDVPSSNSLYVWLNGVLMKPGGDYTLSGSTITFVFAPPAGDAVLASYRK